MKTFSLQLLYIPCASESEAKRIAQALLDARLIACANMVSGVKSLYRWIGEMEESAEVILLAKAPAAYFEAIEREVKALHSYDTPCILSFDASKVHAPFAEWLVAETGGSSA